MVLFRSSDAWSYLLSRFNNSNMFEIEPDQTKDCGVSSPPAYGKLSIDL